MTLGRPSPERPERSPEALGRSQLRRSQQIGLLVGGLIAAYPTFLSVFPFGSEAPDGLAAVLGLGLVAGAALQAALAFAILLGLVRDVRRAALLVSVAMVVFAVLVIGLTGATNGFGSPRDLALPFTLGGPTFALSGALLALGSVTIGPNLAAVLVGDLYFAIALLWPVRPDGQPGMFTIMVSWAGPWIVLAAIATWVELGGGGQPRGAILAILLLGYLGAFIPIVFLFGQHHTPQVFPREWLDVGEEAILVGVGVLFMAAGVGLHGRRDGRARTKLA